MTVASTSFPKKAKAMWQYIVNRINSDYPADERRQFGYFLMEHFFGCERTDIMVDGDIEIPLVAKEDLHDAIARLNNDEPIQYILGYTEFCGLKLNVNPHVLIPRPETEELVNLVISESNFDAPTILDIGTGSGCIPIALKSNLPKSIVYAVDIDPKALRCARQNADKHQFEIEFAEFDLFKGRIPYRNLDIIVSNPPYVLEAERPLMHTNVLAHEPGLALFVPNDDPLKYYNAILKNASPSLNPGGKVFFEINEQFGKEINELLFSHGFKNITIVKDIFDKDRMALAEMP